MFGIKRVFPGGWHPYTYRDTRSAELGAGVSELALERPQSLLPTGIAGPRYNVQASLATTAPAFVKQTQDFVPVAINGNGLGMFQGTVMQGLTNAPQVKQG